MFRTSRLSRSASRSIDLRRPALIVDGQRHVRVHEVPGHCPDRGKWRSKIVRNRVQQRGLERVALSGHFRGSGLGREPIPDYRLAQLIGRGGQQPRMRPAGERIRDLGESPTASPIDFRAHGDRHSERDQTSGASPLRFEPRTRAALPAGAGSLTRIQLGCSAPVEWRTHRAASAGRGSSGELSATTRSSRIDGPRPIQTLAIWASRASRATRSEAASSAVLARGDVAAHGEHGHGFGAPKLGLPTPLQLEGAQPADRDGDDEEEQ